MYGGKIYAMKRMGFSCGVAELLREWDTDLVVG